LKVVMQLVTQAAMAVEPTWQ